MITSISNVRPSGPGRLSFEIAAGDDGANEPVVLEVDGRTIDFGVTVEPDEVRTVTVWYDQPDVKSVVVSAPESGILVSPPLFDAEGYGMQFQSPRPKDIIFCDDCGKWHERDKSC